MKEEILDVTVLVRFQQYVYDDASQNYYVGMCEEEFEGE